MEGGGGGAGGGGGGGTNPEIQHSSIIYSAFTHIGRTNVRLRDWYYFLCRDNQVRKLFYFK